MPCNAYRISTYVLLPRDTRPSNRIDSLPREGPGDHPRNHHVTRPAQYQPAVEHRQGDPPCEPQQARQAVEEQYHPFVEEAAVGFAAACEDGVEEEVGEDEEGEG